MHRRRGLLAPLVGAAMLAVAAPPASAVIVGTGPAGTIALRFDGRVAEAGRYFTFYGHLTAVRGWSDATVFAGPRRPSRARLTFVATTELTRRSTVGLRRFSVESRGQLRVFLQTLPGATFDDPVSFTSPIVVAIAEAHIRTLVVPVAARGGAVRTSVTGTLTLSANRPFSLFGASYQLGSPGMRVRLVARGTGNVSNIYLPAAELSIAGRATVAR
jgi:hypothetical protein